MWWLTESLNLDPGLLVNRDPDPGLDVWCRIFIRISSWNQGCGYAFISSGSGSRVLMTKNLKKLQLEKKLNFFWSKTIIFLSLGLHKERPSYRRSLQLSKEAIQTSKHELKIFFSTFVGHFWHPGSGSGIRIRIHWPDWIRIQSPGWKFFVITKAMDF